MTAVVWRKADSLDGAITALFGPDVVLTGRQPVYGGDINRAFRLDLSNGEAVFIKENSLPKLSFFETEADGLQLLRQPGVIGVPRVLALGTDKKRGVSFLLMEYLSRGPGRRDYWEIFGRQLAALHRADCSGLTGSRERPYGLRFDNFIGSTKQINSPRERWCAFFRDCRLEPQFRLADHLLGFRQKRQAERLMEQRLEELLPEPEQPSLLHGDLWSGNALCGPDGRAWILDPAVYVGHHEADLAMTELFGGFPPAFYAAYREVFPIDRGYGERRDLYNLYHLLNHLNLFGTAYLSSVEGILDRFA